MHNLDFDTFDQLGQGEMSTFMQFSFFSNLLSKLKENCKKVDIYFCRQPENDSFAIFMIRITYGIGMKMK